MTGDERLARAFLELHQHYRQAHERLASLDEALGREDARANASFPQLHVFLAHASSLMNLRIRVEVNGKKYIEGSGNVNSNTERSS